MKKLLFALAAIMLLLPAYAMAEWTCPNCGQTGLTDNFCTNCATPKSEADAAAVPAAVTPTPEPVIAPTSAPDPTSTPLPISKTYTSEGALIGDQPQVSSFTCEEMRFTVTFDRPPEAGSRVQFHYLNRENEFVFSDETVANGSDRTFSFPTSKNWKSNEYISVIIEESNDTQTELKFRDFTMTGTREMNYDRYDGNRPFKTFGTIDARFGTVTRKAPVSQVQWYDYISSVTLYYYDENSEDLSPTEDFVKYMESIVRVFLISDGRVTNPDELGKFQEYANEVMPTWANGGRLLPAY